MKKFISLITIVVLLLQLIPTQVDAITSFNLTPSDDYINIFDIVADDSGNYYVSGDIEDDVTGNHRSFIRKIDSIGSTIWEHIEDRSLADDEGFTSLILKEGNIYTVSPIESGSTTPKMLLQKIDGSTGSVLCEEEPNNNTAVGEIIANSVGDIVVVGRYYNGSSYDGYIEKFETAGCTMSGFTSLDNATIDIGTGDLFYALKQSQNGDYYVTGWSGDDAIIYRFDDSLVVVDSVLQNLTALFNAYSGIDFDSAGDLYVSGYGMNASFYMDAFLVKYDENLNLIWNEVVDIGDIDALVEVEVDVNDKVFAVGYTHTTSVSPSEALLVEFATNGDQVSSNNRLSSNEDRYYGITETSNYLVVVGSSGAGGSSLGTLGIVDFYNIYGSTAQITATVDPVISFEIRNAADDDVLTDNVCSLGTLSASATSTCEYRLGIETNATNGFTVYYDADGGLISATDEINAVGEDTVTTGVEEYGLAFSDATGTIDPQGNFTSADSSVPNTSTLVLASSGPYDYQAGVLNTSTLVTHKASISTVTPAGSYSQVVTITVTGNF